MLNDHVLWFSMELVDKTLSIFYLVNYQSTNINININEEEEEDKEPIWIRKDNLMSRTLINEIDRQSLMATKVIIIRNGNKE